MSSDELNLVNLPSDIIRNIIAMEIESVNSISLISPRWNCIVSEQLSRIDRNGLPKIDSLCWTFSPFGTSSLTIRTSHKYANYFGFHNWACFPSGVAECGIFMRVFKNNDQEEYTLMNRIIAMLNRCSCITTLDVDTHISNRKEMLEMLSDELVNVKVRLLKFTGIEELTQETCNGILYLIKKNDVHSVEIAARNETENLLYFLSEAANFVSKIMLSFNNYSYTSQGCWQNLINSLNNDPVRNHVTATWKSDSFRVYITVNRSDCKNLF